MVVAKGTRKSANKDSTHGWVIGHMREWVAHSTDFEVKLWQYSEQPEYPWKTFSGPELIYIDQGSIKLLLEKKCYGDVEEIVLVGKNRDYVLLAPGTTKKVIVLKKPAGGVTVRWPSIPKP